MVVVAGAIVLLAPKHHATTSAQAWDSDAQQAFSSLVGRVPNLVSGASAWVAHTKSDDEFRSEVETDAAAFTRTRDRVSRLKTPKEFAVAHRLYLASADLYVQTAAVYRSAIGKSDVRQYDLLARRLRELGDRVFDRGHTALGLPTTNDPNIDVKAPEEVPIWTAEGLAAGPPLDDAPPAPATSPPLRAASRPQESRAAWERDVKKANAPAASALHTTSFDRLRAVARRYVAAAEFLRGRPDPANGREESARLRLSWLTYADAARARQLRLGDLSRQLEQAAARIAP